ncbi:MAG: sigma-E factor regulatory protein RseB domain-containing protein [Pseudolysinimonas sp.]
MKNSVRWLPAVIAPVLIAAGAIAIPAVANAASTPPSKTAQQVLTLIAGAKDAAYSGTVEQTSDLGLPQLPSVGPGSSSTGSDATSQILDLLTANHTARIFVDGAKKERVQVLDSLAERDVVRNGSEVWTYDSKTKTATHVTLTPPTPGSHLATPGATPPADPGAESLTPAALADKFLAAIEPSTKVSVSSTSSVAGRPVYQLELTPKTGSTLISSVTLSVDAKTGLPLKVVVDARGQKSDAFAVGFRTIDFSAPAASLFEFTPPKGATVTTPKADKPKPATGDSHQGATKPTVTGTGWASIVELPAGAAGASGAPGSTAPGASASQSRLLNELTTSVAGGRALQTSLLSVLMTSDGRILIGAVPIASLEAAAQ